MMEKLRYIKKIIKYLTTVEDDLNEFLEREIELPFGARNIRIEEKKNYCYGNSLFKAPMTLVIIAFDYNHVISNGGEVINTLCVGRKRIKLPANVRSVDLDPKETIVNGDKVRIKVPKPQDIYDLYTPKTI